MALEVGSVFARLGARVDDDGFRRYERLLEGARRDARHDLEADLKADVDSSGFRRFERELAHADRDVSHRTGRMRGALVGIGKGAAIAGAALAGGLAIGAKKAWTEFEEAAKVTAQTEAVIRSTGQAANVTADDVEKLSTALSNKTAIDDETIQKGANMLLTFRNLRNEAGAGNDVFNQATGIITDMSVALGTDMKSAAIQVGKALNDPAIGLTALSRSGVTFTEQQKETIKSLFESGNQMKAQKMILRELNTEFAGSAEAQARPMDKAKVAVNNLFEAIGRKLAPTIESVAGGIAKFVNGMTEGTGAGGRFVTILRGVADAVGDVGRWVGSAFETISSAFRGGDKSATGLVHSFAQTFGQIWRTVKGTAHDVAEAFSGMGDSLGIIFERVRQVVTVAVGIWLAVFRRALPGIRSMFTGIAKVVSGVVDVIAGLLTLDFGRIVDGFKKILGGVVQYARGWVRTITAPFREAVARVWDIVTDGFGKVVSFAKGLPGKLFNAVKSLVSKWVDLNIDLRRKAINGIVDVVRGVVNRAKDLPGDLWNAIKSGVGRVADFARNIGEKGRDAGRKLLDGVVNIARDLPGKVADIASNMVSRFVDGIAKLPGAVKNALTSIGGLAADVGRAIANWVNDNTLFGDPIHIGIPGPIPDINFTLPRLAQGGRVGPSLGGARFFIAGEGLADEWVISQEGPRDANVRWAREALETLTGRRVELHKAGKGIGGAKQRKAAGTARGRVRTGEQGIAKYEDQISNLERDYGQLDRQYGRSEEEIFVEDEDGNLVIDEDAREHRLGELKKLKSARAQVVAVMDAYKRKVHKLVGKYGNAIRKLGAAITKTKAPAGGGKKGKRRRARAKKMRSGYAEIQRTYRERKGELSTLETDLGQDLQDQALDYLELDDEATTLFNEKAPEPDPVPRENFGPDFLSDAQNTTLGNLLLDEAEAKTTATPDDDEGARAALEDFWEGVIAAGGLSTSEAIAANQSLAGYLPSEADTGTGGGGASDPETPAAPSPEDVAAAALAQITAFDTSRAEIFGAYAGNFVGGGARYNPMLASAAGARYYGAGSGGGGIVGGAGGVQQNVYLTLNDPGDVHTFTQAALFELAAAV